MERSGPLRFSRLLVRLVPPPPPGPAAPSPGLDRTRRRVEAALVASSVGDTMARDWGYWSGSFLGVVSGLMLCAAAVLGPGAVQKGRVFGPFMGGGGRFRFLRRLGGGRGRLSFLFSSGGRRFSCGVCFEGAGGFAAGEAILLLLFLSGGWVPKVCLLLISTSSVQARHFHIARLHLLVEPFDFLLFHHCPFSPANRELRVCCKENLCGQVAWSLDAPGVPPRWVLRAFESTSFHPVPARFSCLVFSGDFRI